MWAQEMPGELERLSPKRRKKLQDDCMTERKDAALCCCMLGIKGANHVHKLGLQRLAKLATAWGAAITEYYRAGEEMVLRLDSGDCGDLITDPITGFADLSDSRRRKIAQWFVANRQDAQNVAFTIGQRVIARECGFGEERMERLNRQWRQDLKDFYEDRETNEPRLKAWIEDIGFLYEDGKLQCYKGEGGKPVRKRTAEKWMEE